MLLGHAKIESTARFLRVPTTSPDELRRRIYGHVPLKLRTAVWTGVTRDTMPTTDVGWTYSITSSAVICMITGTVRPSALAVLRLITNWNFVGCSMGRSAGFAPFRILST
jgi:hypothetical protein